jgi:ABC-type nitrate/sulfonate/bicarbonate transport system permease component
VSQQLPAGDLAQEITSGQHTADSPAAAVPPWSSRALFTSRWSQGVFGLAGTVLAVLALQLVSVTGLVSAHDIPPAFDILGTLGQQALSSSLWHITGQTLEQAAIGLGIATVLAVPAGIAIGSSDWLWRATRPTVEFLRPVPSVALIPLTILLYGSGVTSSVLLVAFGSFWAVLIHAIFGIREVDDVASDTMRAFAIGPVRRLLYLVLPSALPYIATGVRLGATGALIISVTSELAIGVPGLGNSIILAENNGNVRLMYALILATGILGVAIHVLLDQIEARLLHWHPSHRSAATA